MGGGNAQKTAISRARYGPMFKCIYYISKVSFKFILYPLTNFIYTYLYLDI